MDKLKKLSELAKTIALNIPVDKTDTPMNFGKELALRVIRTPTSTYVRLERLCLPSVEIILSDDLEPCRISFVYCTADAHVDELIKGLENEAIKILEAK